MTDWYVDEYICNKLGGRLPRDSSFEELSFVESLLLGARYNPDLTPVPSPFRFYPGSGAYIGLVLIVYDTHTHLSIVDGIILVF